MPVKVCAASSHGVRPSLSFLRRVRCRRVAIRHAQQRSIVLTGMLLSTPSCNIVPRDSFLALRPRPVVLALPEASSKRVMFQLNADAACFLPKELPAPELLDAQKYMDYQKYMQGQGGQGGQGGSAADYSKRVEYQNHIKGDLCLDVCIPADTLPLILPAAPGYIGAPAFVFKWNLTAAPYIPLVLHSCSNLQEEEAIANVVSSNGPVTQATSSRLLSDSQAKGEEERHQEGMEFANFSAPASASSFRASTTAAPDPAIPTRVPAPVTTASAPVPAPVASALVPGPVPVTRAPTPVSLTRSIAKSSIKTPAPTSTTSSTMAPNSAPATRSLPVQKQVQEPRITEQKGGDHMADSDDEEGYYMWLADQDRNSEQNDDMAVGPMEEALDDCGTFGAPSAPPTPIVNQILADVVPGTADSDDEEGYYMWLADQDRNSEQNDDMAVGPMEEALEDCGTFGAPSAPPTPMVSQILADVVRGNLDDENEDYSEWPPVEAQEGHSVGTHHSDSSSSVSWNCFLEVTDLHALSAVSTFYHQLARSFPT